MFALLNTSRYSEALRLAENLRSEVPPGALENAIAVAMYMSGASLDSALERNLNALNYNRVRADLDKTRFLHSVDNLCSCLCERSLMLTLRGYWDAAVECEEQSIQRAKV